MRPLFPAVLAVALASSTAAQTPSADQLARQTQARYDQIKDFTADFTMTYQGPLLRQKTIERGTVKLKKPNRMWWKYTAPDKKEYVADGVRFYTYLAQDKIGMQTDLTKVSNSSTFLLFLAGKGDLSRDFTPALAPAQPEGEWRLVLTPKTKQEDYRTLTLIVDRRSLDLRGLVQQSDEGTHTFAFTDFRSNTGLKDSDFLFTFPKGTEIR
jgi:outer membrane lipoprotein carrier protein